MFTLQQENVIAIKKDKRNLKLNIFKEVKSAVSVKDAAIFYGMNPNRNGLCQCPFHNDKTPSLKVDIRYYCFGCGATGDVVDFVGKLFSLPPLAAATKIANDFGIDCGFLSPHKQSSKPPKQNPTILQKNNEYQIQRAFDLYVRDALFSLHEYREKIRMFKQNYAPTMEQGLDNCHPLFEEALMNLDRIDWMIDELTFGYRDEQIDFINTYKGEIANVKRRNEELN